MLFLKRPTYSDGEQVNGRQRLGVSMQCDYEGIAQRSSLGVMDLFRIPILTVI